MPDNRLTSRSFWNQLYVKTLRRPRRIRTKTNLATAEVTKLLKSYLPVNQTFKLIEIGCAPGAWLHYFTVNFGYRSDGIEYTPAGCQLTTRNLELLGVASTIYCQDFLDNRIPPRSYDVVLSVGFIEHFLETDQIVEKHLDLLKNQGYLVIILPNLNGFNHYYQSIVSSSLLASHDRRIMNLDFLNRLPRRHQVRKITARYCGLVNFGLFRGPYFLLLPGYFLQLLLTLIYNIFGSLPLPDNKFLSPYLVGIYQKYES